MIEQFDSEVLSIAAADGRSPRKRAVLNAAITLFAERGYDRVSVRDIGRRLEMTGPSLYRHYESKADLLADAVALVIEAMIAGLLEISASHVSTGDRLEAAIEFHSSFAVQHQIYLQVYHREAHHLAGPARKIHRQRAATYRDIWVELLLGGGRATDQAQAEILYAMLMAMVNFRIPTRPNLSPSQLIELIAQHASAMLAVGNEPAS